MHPRDGSPATLDQTALLQGFHARQLVEGELLVSPGSPRNSVFILRGGRLRVYLAFEDKEYTLAFLEPGDIYSTHSGAYVQAVQPTEVLVATPANGRHLRRRDGAVRRSSECSAVARTSCN